MLKKSANLKIVKIVIVIFFVATSLFLVLMYKKPSTGYSWNLKKISSSEYELYLEGKGVENATVADVRFFSDGNVEAVTSGGFYSNAIINQINEDMPAFLVIKTPDNLVDTTKPLLLVKLVSDSDIAVLPSSQIYISEKGAFSPKSQ